MQTPPIERRAVRRARKSASRRATRTGATNDEALSRRLEKAVARHQAGDVKAAIRDYETVLKHQKDHVDALQFLGIARHQLGNSADGLPLIERAADLHPHRPEIQVNLGKVYQDTGRLEDAVKAYRRALDADPVNLQARINLSVCYVEQGKKEDALALTESLVRQEEGATPNLLRQLGNLYLAHGDFENAAQYLERHLERAPNDSFALSNLATVYEGLGQPEQAREIYNRAFIASAGSESEGHGLIRALADPQQGEAALEAFLVEMESYPGQWARHTSMARALGKLGWVDVALQIFRKVVAIHPDDANIWNDVGTCLTALNKYEEARGFFTRAIEITPELAEAYSNLGNTFMLERRYMEAAEAYKKAIAIRPRFLGPHINLCQALRQLYRLDEANLYARAALMLEDVEPGHFGNPYQVFRMTCDFDSLAGLGDVFALAGKFPADTLGTVFLDLLVSAPDYEKQKHLFDLQKSWAHSVEKQAAANPLPTRKPRESRDKIRVGFLSSDFKGHSVARFLMPLFRNYDKTRFEFYCYTPERVVGDTLQNLFQTSADSFTFVDGLTEREVAEVIWKDDLDILIELNGFTMATRISSLAYRPAPVQMCWLGYPFTSGMEAVDYLIADPLVAPVHRELYVENILELPESWVCFGNFAHSKITETLPLERNGCVTFGTLNNPYKYTPEMIALWARVLKTVPSSRFLVVRPETASMILCGSIADTFEKCGIGRDRLYFVNNRGKKASHFTYYNEIDITLDTYPLCGGTTTCDALWMGVPVVSLVGDAFFQRMSYSILNNVGLGDLCVSSPDAYVAKAVELAADDSRLIKLRYNLRAAIEASPLCQTDKFLGHFQAALLEVAHRHGLAGVAADA